MAGSHKFKLLTCGWALQLSTNKAIFHPLLPNFSSHFLNHYSNMAAVIQALLLASYSTGRQVTPRNHLGFLNLPIARSGNFSEPVMFVHTRIMTLSLLILPPVQVLPDTAWILSSNSRHYRPISSALKTSQGSYILRTGSKTLSVHSSHTSLSTAAFSPQTLR